MRKRLMILALVLIAVLMTCTLAACSGGGGRCSGGHTWDEGTVKEAATCTESGTLINKCTVCGIKREVAIEALGHDLQTIPGTVVEPTCEEDGYAGKKACVREGCEYVLDTGTIIPAIGHAYGDWTSNGDGTHKRVCANDSNHVESGNCSGGTADCGHKAVCDVCGGEYGDFASSHVFDKQVTTDAYKATDATCEAKATYYYSCQCGEKGTETFEFGDYADHVFDREVADPEYLVSVATCTSPAIYNKSCACGLEGTETFEFGDALPHTFDKQVATDAYKATDATCTAKATYYYSCDCGAHGTATFACGDMLAHVFDKEVAEDKYLASAATCEKKATYYKSCYCGHFDADVSATFESGELGDHVYDNKVVNETYKATGATCTEKATYYFSCDCGKAGTETFESGETHPHTYDKEVAEDKYLKFAANCASAAVYYKSCACGHFDAETSHTFFYGAPSGNHVFDREVATDDYKATDATCTAKATYYYSCECGEKGITTFEAGATLDHTMTHHAAVDATCVSTGNVEYWTCSTCSLNYDSATGGNVIDDVTTAIDSTNHVHTTISKPAVAPDCENTGLTAEVSCADCDKVLEEREEVPALGHKGGTATCKDKAVCEVCGEAYGELANHTPGEIKVENNVAPSCTAEGSYDNVVYCSVCDHELSRETITVDKVAHTGGTATCVEKATCSVCGEKYGDLADHSWDEGVVTTPATCTTEGVMTFTCTVDNCGETRTETIAKSAHNFVDNVCEDCQATVSYVDKTIVFTFGENGNAEHKDGSPDKATYTETKDGYTLSISGGSKMYPGSFDAKGNSALKLGTSSVVGKFEFTVPVDVKEVVIYVAGYKANTAKITVNDVAYSITTKSNDGAYTEIKVDTTTNKKVSFTTVSGGVRCMINTIEFKVSAENICNHENREVDEVVTPTCTVAGHTTYVCPDCDHVFDADFVDATGHTLVSIPAVAPTCENTGLTEGEKCSVCDHVTIEQTIVDMLPCVDGDNDEYCDNCHKPMCEHVYGAWTYVNADTHNHVCTLCGKEEVAGHDYEVTSHVDATCEEAGSTTYTCADCGHEYTETHVALGHDEITHDALAPTCSAVGWEAYVTCSRCDYTTYVELPIDADAHKWDAGTVTTPATCTEAGERLHTCEHNAEHTKVEAISATGHTPVKNVCACGYEYSVDEIIALAEALAKGDSLNGTYRLSGVITNAEAFNTNYNSVTVTISVDGATEEFSLLCYGMKGEGVEVIGVGDTITVSGEIKNYNGTIEFNTGCALESYIPAEFEVYLEVFGKGTVSGDFAGIYSRGDEITVTVNENEGYKVGKVLANGATVESETNEYTFTVTGNTTLEVYFVSGDSHISEEEITFTFGANGTASHNDGTDFTTKSYTENGYTLALTNGTKAYAGARDAKGNSALKLGTSSAVGSFTFTVPADVSSVEIYVAKYKAKTTKVTINGGTAQTISTSSDNGEYTAITVDTTTNKTITISTVSGATRCMIDKIVFVAQVEAGACAHENWSDYVVTTPATCSERGVETATCDDCGETKTRQIPVDPTLHVYNETITTPATCTQPGLKTLTCECGDTKTEEIAATGHDYDSVVTAPTCTTGGYTTHTCSVCGDTYKDSETSATGHTEETIPAVAPDCESEGLTEGKKCSVCDNVLVEQSVVPATGHTEVVDAAVEATCTTAGKTEGKHCSVCNEVLVAQTVVPATGHSEKEPAKENIVDATCEADGSYEMNVYCATCGELLSSQKHTTDKLGHDYVSTVTKDSTCTETGVRTYTCTHDNSHTYTEVIEKLSHTPAAAVEENREEATCTKEGSYDSVVKCSVCGEELSRETKTIDKVAHSSVEIPAVAPTCTEKGKTAGAECSACGEILTAQTDVDALGHKAETVAGKDATCTETGLTDGSKCSVCGEILVAQEEIAAKGHTEVVDAAVAPTCTTTGLTEGKHCSVCDEVLVAQTVVGALGHTEVVDNAVAPTCTATGLTEGKHCSVCDEVLVAQTVVDALGHTEVVDAAVAATCTTTGLTEGKHCSVCGTVLVAQETVAALGHKAETVAGKDATCTETGLTDGSKCSVCGETLTAQQTIPATGHTEVIDAAVAPTCTETGLTEGKHCSVCSEVLVAQTVVDALGHEWEWVIDTPATVTSTGLKHEECTRCDATQSHNTIIDILICAHTDTLVHNAKVDADCENAGNIEYWHCTACGKNYSDDDGQIAVENITIPATGHNYNSVVTAPTCTADGYTTHTCTKCEDSYVDTPVEALGHTEGEVVVENNVDPTCTTAGSYDNVVYCSVCDVELSRNKVTVDALGHDEVEHEAEAPTCTEIGWDAYVTCSRCDYTTYAEKAALGHDEVEHEAEAPTCTEIGWDAYVTCSRCDYTTYAEKAKLGHDYVAGNVVAPGCDTDGYTIYNCSRCEATENRDVVDALGHNLVDGYVVIDDVLYTADKCDREGCDHYEGQVAFDDEFAPVSNEDDIRTVLQNGFNATLTSDITLEVGSIEIAGKTVTIDLNGHNITVTGEKAGVCEAFYVQADGDLTINGNGTILAKDKGAEHVITLSAVDGAVVTINGGDFVSEGSTAVYATRGAVVNIYGGTYSAVAYEGQMFTIDVNEAEAVLGVINVYGGTYHNFDPANHTNDGTYTNKVMDGYHSIKDDDNYVVSAHTEVVDAAVDATCTATGLTEGKHCSVCGEILVAQQEVALKDHTAEAVAGKDATCTETGLEDGSKCSVCGKVLVEQVEIPALGHDYVAGNVVAPKCEEQGYTIFDCSRCDATENRNHVDATGHTEVVDAAVAPKCEATGLTEGKHCSVCEKVLVAQEVVAATGHTEVTDDAVDATCTTAGKTEGKHCSVCGTVTKAQETIDALGHTGGTATCTEKATCTVCGEAYGEFAAHTEETLPAVDATCTTTGLTAGKKCSVCGEILVAQEEISALGHDEIPHVAQAPTCTEVGWEAYDTCSRCDYTTKVELKALGHEMTHHAEKDSTCTTEGNIEYWSCSTCGKNYKDEAGTIVVEDVKTAKADHNYVDGMCTVCFTVKKSSAITFDMGENGSASHNDGSLMSIDHKIMDTTENHTLPLSTVANVYGSARDLLGNSCLKLGTSSKAGSFSFTVPDEITEVVICVAKYKANGATVTINGKAYTLTKNSNNGEYDEIVVDTTTTKTVSFIVTSGYRCMINTISFIKYVECDHTENTNEEEVVPPTCTEQGYTLHNCSVCQSTYKTDFVDALGHDYDSVVTEPTCEDDGYTTHTCSKCGDSYTDTPVDKLGHMEVVDEGVPATCIATGLTEGSHCSRCNEILVEQEEIAKTDCVDDDDNNECDVCGGTICEHTSFDEWVVVTPATCTEDGKRTRQCKSCDYIDEETITALGHDLTNHDAQEPTCTATGWDAYVTCSRCDYTTKVEKPALGHSGFTYVNNGSQHNKVCGVCEQTIATEDHDVDATGKCTICDTQLYSVYTYTFTEKQYSANGTKTLGDLDWTLAGDGNYWSYDATKGQHLGSGNAPYKTLTLTSSALTGVQKIVINTSGASSTAAQFTVSVGGTKVGDVTSLTATATDYVFSNINNLSGAVEFAYTQTSSKAIYIKSITIHYAAPCEHKHTESRAAVESTCTTQGTAEGTFCTDCQSYVSGGELLPLIDHSYGDWYDVTNVTCTTNGSKTHKCSVCEYTETITTNATGHNFVDGECTNNGCDEKVPSGETQTPITASKTMAELITSEGWDGNTTKQSFNLDENVSVKINGGSNTGKAYDGDHIRIYATDSPAGTITISVPDGYELVSVNVSTKTGTYAFLYLGEGTTDISNVETAVSGQSVVLNSVKNGSDGKQVRVTAIEVVYKKTA